MFNESRENQNILSDESGISFAGFSRFLVGLHRQRNWANPWESGPVLFFWERE